jgi:hypothetical protein
MQAVKTINSRGRAGTLSGRAGAPGGRAAAALAFTVLAIGALTLGGCTVDPEEKAPQCPAAKLLPDASSLTRYNGNGTDLTNLVLSAKLVDVQGACIGLLGHAALSAHAHPEMLLTRGPAATGRDADVPYVVAVTRNNMLLDRKEKVQHVTFPDNVDTVRVTPEDTYFNLPTKRGLGGEKYTIYFLLNLTPAELAANQRALGK